MPHPIPAPDLVPYKKGDKVRHINSGQYATVAEDQTDPLLVKINWDKRPEGPQDYRADAFEVAPWHGLVEPTIVLELTLPEPPKGGAVKIDPIHLRNFREAGLLDPEKLPKVEDAERKYRAGDRVKLKYARRAGTVRGYHKDGQLVMEWDHASGLAKCPEEDVVPLHTPRDTDPVNPNQPAIDAIEALRVPLKKEIEALQAKLGNLTRSQKLLERG